MMVTLALAAFFPSAGHAAAWGVLIAGRPANSCCSAATPSRQRRACRSFARPRLDEDVRAFFQALGPATVGSMGTQVALFADTIIATFLAGRRAVGAVLRRPPQPAADRRDRDRHRHRAAAGDVAAASAGDRAPARMAAQRARVRVHAAVLGAVRGGVPDRARSSIMRAMFARGAFSKADAARGRDARGLCGRAHSLRDHPQRDGSDISGAWRHLRTAPVISSLIAAAVNVGLKFC